MSDQLPGVDRIDLHEGRFMGPFDLLRADMAQVRIDGRVMVVVVADVLLPLTLVETKDGDVKAKWTFKAVDVALVRDGAMQNHLSEALHMIGVDSSEEETDEAPVARVGMMGVYDEEGTFLGFQPIESFTTDEEEVVEPAPAAVEEEDDEPEKPRVPLFRTPGTPPRPQPPGEYENVEVYGEPIKRKDSQLDDFLYREKAGV